MSDLSPGTRALLDTGRDGEEPNLRDYVRNRKALARKLGAGALVAGLGATTGAAAASGAGAAGASVAGAAGASVAAKILLPFVVGSVVAGAALGTVHTHEATTRAAPALVSPPAAVSSARTATVRAIVDPPPAEASGQAPPDVASEAPPPTASAVREPRVREPRQTWETSAAPTARRVTADNAATPRAPARSSVSEEIDLLRRAEERFHGGAPADALALLDQHAQRFPRGALAEERRASRILVLCRLGQVAAARAEAETFVTESPASPFTERVRRACGEPPRSDR